MERRGFVSGLVASLLTIPAALFGLGRAAASEPEVIPTPKPEPKKIGISPGKLPDIREVLLANPLLKDEELFVFISGGCVAYGRMMRPDIVRPRRGPLHGSERNVAWFEHYLPGPEGCAAYTSTLGVVHEAMVGTVDEIVEQYSTRLRTALEASRKARRHMSREDRDECQQALAKVRGNFPIRNHQCDEWEELDGRTTACSPVYPIIESKDDIDELVRPEVTVFEEFSKPDLGKPHKSIKGYRVSGPIQLGKPETELHKVFESEEMRIYSDTPHRPTPEGIEAARKALAKYHIPFATKPACLYIESPKPLV